MSGSTTFTPAPMRPNDVPGATGRYLIVQPSGTGLTMLIDTVVRPQLVPDRRRQRSLRLAADEVRAGASRIPQVTGATNRCAFTTTETPT